MGLVSEFAGSESCIYFFSASVKNVGYVMICVCLASCIKNFTVELCWDFTFDRRCFTAVCQVSECTGSKICVFLFNLRKKCEYCNNLCLASCVKNVTAGPYSDITLGLIQRFFVAMHQVSECAGCKICVYFFSACLKNCKYLMMCVSGQLCQKLYSWTFLR